MGDMWLHYKHPYRLVLAGAVIILACIGGLFRFDTALLETDVTKLISPTSSKSLEHQEEMIKLFGENLTAHDFYPYQAIRLGYDMAVLLEERRSYYNKTERKKINFITKEALKKVIDFNNRITFNVTIADMNGRTLSFNDLCAKQYDRCVVKGSEIFERSFLSALEKGIITWPNFGDINLSAIFDDVETENGTLISATTLRLRYFLRQDSPYYRTLSSDWISKFPQNISVPNVSLYHPLSALDRSDVPVGFSMLSTITLLAVFFACVMLWSLCGCPKSILMITVVTLASIGVIGYIRIRLVKDIVLVFGLVLYRVNLNMGLSVDGWYVNTHKKRLQELLALGISVIVFGVGLFSNFPIVRTFCAGACIAMAMCLLVICVSYTLQNIPALQDNTCCFSKPMQTSESKNKYKTINELSGKCFKTCSLMLYVLFLSGAVYGFINTLGLPGLCDMGSYTNCNKLFGNVIFVSLVVKPGDEFDFNMTKTTLSTFIESATKTNVLSRDNQINWMTAFSTSLEYRQAGFTNNSLKTFLSKNPRYRNDIKLHVHDWKVVAFRIFFKTVPNKLSNSADFSAFIKKLQNLENDAEFDCYFYAPEFLYFEGYLDSDEDFLRLMVIAVGLYILFLFAAFYTNPFTASIQLMNIISLLFGVLGYMHTIRVGISFISTIPVLIIITTNIDLIICSPKFKRARFCVSFSWLKWVLLALLGSYIQKSIFIPNYLYGLFAMFHFYLFSPALFLPLLSYIAQKVKG